MTLLLLRILDCPSQVAPWIYHWFVAARFRQYIPLSPNISGVVSTTFKEQGKHRQPRLISSSPLHVEYVIGYPSVCLRYIFFLPGWLICLYVCTCLLSSKTFSNHMISELPVFPTVHSYRTLFHKISQVYATGDWYSYIASFSQFTFLSFFLPFEFELQKPQQEGHNWTILTLNRNTLGNELPALVIHLHHSSHP